MLLSCLLLLKRTSFIKNKRAAPIIVAALFFISGTIVKASTSDNQSDLIQKAQNLMLQNDRQQAINILVTALKRENKKKKSYHETKKALYELSRVFLLEKTQQQYESAITLKDDDDTEVISKLNEALKLEPNNYLIISEINKRLIEKKECNTAIKNLKEINLQNPFDEMITALLAFAYLCTNEIDRYFAVKSKLETTIIPQSTSHHLEAIRLITEKNPAKLKPVIEALEKIEKDNPQILYYNYKLKLLLKMKHTLEDYEKACKALRARKEREYATLPNFCKHVE